MRNKGKTSKVQLWIGLLVALVGATLASFGCARRTPSKAEPKKSVLSAEGTPIPISTREATPAEIQGAPSGPVSTGQESESISTAMPSPEMKAETVQEVCYEDPKEALDTFLSHLHGGQYRKASQLYAGSYPFERASVSPDEMIERERVEFLTGFLEEYCKGYATCLDHKIVSERAVSIDTLMFGVRFFEENGEPLRLAVPPLPRERAGKRVATQFGLRVVEADGCYSSVDLPPLTP